ncbi:MAG: hypothetical protein AAGH67_14595 [Cyanobacteria bacterium P01_H01_bin.162]
MQRQQKGIDEEKQLAMTDSGVDNSAFSLTGESEIKTQLFILQHCLLSASQAASSYAKLAKSCIGAYSAYSTVGRFVGKDLCAFV